MKSNNNESQFFDKMFKKSITLSTKSVIRFINGLYNKDYPLDATVDYQWTESVDDDNRKTIADTIITINHTEHYHIEAQCYDDESIVFRVFEYGFGFAMKKRDVENNTIVFPEPVIIYFYSKNELPDSMELTVDFGRQGKFLYNVPVVDFRNKTKEEVVQKGEIILIPFFLLKLRDLLTKKRGAEEIRQLKKLIFNDILGSIDENEKLNNITIDDANRLRSMTIKMYNYLYKKYEEFEEVTEMTDESILLDYDIFLKKHRIESLEDTVIRFEHIEEEEADLERRKKEVDDLERNLKNKQKAVEDQQKAVEDQQKAVEDQQKAVEDQQKAVEDKEKQLLLKEEQIRKAELEFERKLEAFRLMQEELQNRK